MDIAALYVEYQPRVLGFVMKAVRNQELAEDITSEVFCRLLNAMQRGFGPEIHISGYIWQIARRVIIDQWRHDSRVKFFNWTDYDPTSELDDTKDPLLHNHALFVAETTDLQTAISQDIQTALQRLTVAQREVISLQWYGYSLSEIAEMINCGESAAKALRHRGMVTLREELKHWNGNHEKSDRRRRYWRNQKP